MKLELDKMRAHWMREYDGLIGPAIGTGDKRSRQIISAWIEVGRKVIVLWGPPGSGKSTRMDTLDKENVLVVETTGMVPAMNAFFRRQPKGAVSYVCCVAPREVCKERIRGRKDHPMQTDADYLCGLVDRWFETPKKKMLGIV